MLFTREFSHVRVIVPSKDENVTDGFCSVVAHDIAEEIVWCASRPAHVNIAQLCKTIGLQEMCTGLISFSQLSCLSTKPRLRLLIEVLKVMKHGSDSKCQNLMQLYQTSTWVYLNKMQ